jgi:hypothetical protein
MSAVPECEAVAGKQFRRDKLQNSNLRDKDNAFSAALGNDPDGYRD